MIRRAWIAAVAAAVILGWWWHSTTPPTGEPASAPNPADPTSTAPRQESTQLAAAAPTSPERSTPPAPSTRDAAQRDPGSIYAEALQRDFACAELPLTAPAEQSWTLGLPEAQIEAATRQRAAALAWATRECAGSSAAARELRRRDAVHAAEQAGDPWARLALLTESDSELHDAHHADALREALRSVLPAALAEPDPARYTLIGAALLALETESNSWSARHNSDWMLWPLLACDLGADCRADSTIMHSLCLRHDLCGYHNLHSALRDGLWPPLLEPALEQQRQTLLAQLRTGGAGLLDPAMRHDGDAP